MLGVFIANSVIFGLLAVAWRKDDFINFLVKSGLFTITIINVYYIFKLGGVL